MTLKVRIDSALLAKLTKQAEEAAEQGLLTAEQARAAMVEEFAQSGIKLEADIWGFKGPVKAAQTPAQTEQRRSGWKSVPRTRRTER